MKLARQPTSSKWASTLCRLKPTGCWPLATVVAFVAHTACHLIYVSCNNRYNISCYSSLLQQVDATADAEIAFQQHTPSTTAGQAQVGPYAAVWLHPDDLQHLQQLQQPSSSSATGSGSASGVEAAAARQSFAAGALGGGGGSRPSTVGAGMIR